MTDKGVLPRRAFLRLATGAGLALAATAVAACETARPPWTEPPRGTLVPAPVPSRSPSPSATESAPSGAPSATPRASATPTPAAPSASTVPGPTPKPVTSIARENARQGHEGWALGIGLAATIEGYAAPASAEPGERLALHVYSPVPYDVDWYRIGWYDGAGARRVHRDVSQPAQPDRSLRVDPSLGLVEADWPAGPSVTIPDSWRSGMYVAVLRPVDGTAPRAVPFIVRSPLRSPAPTLFLSALTTWQAYNGWGGKSLYTYNSTGDVMPTGTQAAATVGFDRPYDWDGGLGYLRKWEAAFIRWMERFDREVDYAADIDLGTRPEILAGRRLAVSAGHPEYWSLPMRDAIESSVGSGLNAAFFTANELYWQIRTDPSPNGPDRRITCYKSAKRDPMRTTHPELTTCRWREVPVSRPEARFLGVMYGHVVAVPADWVVRSSRHWLYKGTGLQDGDRIAALVGQEYDAYFADLAPAGTIVVARSPVLMRGTDPDADGNVASPAMHSATLREPHGKAGGVFAAGTFQWSWALDGHGQHAYNGRTTPLDARVRRMTANIFDRWSA